MFRRLFKKVTYLVDRSKSYTGDEEAIKSNIDKIPKSIADVKNKLSATFVESQDIILREIEVGKSPTIKMIIAYVEGLVDINRLENSITIPLLSQSGTFLIDERSGGKDKIKSFTDKLIPASQVKYTYDFKKSVSGILSGHVLIYIDGENRAIKAAIQKREKRSIVDPENERSIKGPKESFIESLFTNVSLLRHIIKSPKFKFETMEIGQETNTMVGICYIKGIADEGIVDTVKKRLKKINVDAILDGGYIEQYIEDESISIFPTVGNSERPDKVASKILEGRVAILVDGSPVVLTVPNLFLENFQATGDYYSRPYFTSANRILRLISFVISTGLPAFYVALVVFHFDVIPIRLLLAISATREQIPFSPLVEALIMMVIFELLREVGIRMPNAVGQTINIVGGLVMGQAAVSAKIVSPIMIIVVALTGITNYMLPALSDTLPLIRFLLLFASRILGFLGLSVAYIVLLLHLCSLESVGVPYMYPIAPADTDGLKDSIIRFPLWTMKIRPGQFIRENLDRAEYRMKGQNHVRKEDKRWE